MTAESASVEMLSNLLVECSRLANDSEFRTRPAVVVWARAVGVDPANLSDTIRAIRHVLRAIERVEAAIESIPNNRSDDTARSLRRLTEYLSTAHLDERADRYFGGMPGDWAVCLESCSFALRGTGRMSTLPRAVLNEILGRVSDLEALVTDAHLELGDESARLLLSLLGQVRRAVEECIIGGPQALIDLVDSLSGQTLRKQKLLVRVAAHPATVAVLQLIAAVAAVTAVVHGPMSDGPAWNGPALPSPDVSVVCILNPPPPTIDKVPPSVRQLPPTT